MALLPQELRAGQPDGVRRQTGEVAGVQDFRDGAGNGQLPVQSQRGFPTFGLGDRNRRGRCGTV